MSLQACKWSSLDQICGGIATTGDSNPQNSSNIVDSKPQKNHIHWHMFFLNPPCPSNLRDLQVTSWSRQLSGTPMAIRWFKGWLIHTYSTIPSVNCQRQHSLLIVPHKYVFFVASKIRMIWFNFVQHVLSFLLYLAFLFIDT